jgi:hypothetical protein
MIDSHIQRPKPRVMGTSDGPPRPSRVDRIIDLHKGSTTAIEATPEKLQASEESSISSLPERILQLQMQNGRLYQEVAYYRQMEQAREKFQDIVTQVSGELQRALSKLGKIQRQVNYEQTQMRQENMSDIQKNP